MPIGKRKLRVKYGSMSESCKDDGLDIAIEKGEIVKCIRTGGSDGLSMVARECCALTTAVVLA